MVTILNGRLVVAEHSIIAAGPLTKQRSTLAYRIVLRADVSGGRTQLVVHVQYFPKFTEELPDMSMPYFENGDYFHLDEIGEATECFARRLLKQAVYVSSITSTD